MRLAHIPIILATGLASSLAAAEPLEVIGDRLFVDVQVNGKTISALLDSGAEMTILDDETAALLALEPTSSTDARGTGAGTVEAAFAGGVSLQAVGVTLANRTVAILDLDDIAERLVGRDLPMILGRDLFDAARLQVDIAGGTIETVGVEETPPGVRLELTTHDGIENIQASVEGHAPVLATFDLGNGSDVLVGRAYAERIGLTAPERIIDKQSGGGIGGALDREIVMLESLTVGGVVFRNIRAAIDPSDSASDLNIGVRILRNFLITTDFPQCQLWLAKIAQ